MAEERRKKQQLAVMVGGAVAVAAVGYWYYSSQPTTQEEGSNFDEDKIEQITVAEPKKSDSNSFEERKSYDDESAPPMTNEADEVDVESVEVKMPDPEPVAAKEPEPFSVSEPVEPEESPVIVEPEPTAQELEAQRKREEAARRLEREEKEREDARQREEQRVEALARKYSAIADGVKATKKWFRYKNGKLRIKVLRATNVDKKDMGKADFSDCYVKMVVPHSKKQESSVKKDTENPVWNEQFEMDVRDALKDTVTLTLMDQDTMAVDDKIGTVEVNVVDICGADKSQIVNRGFDVKGSKKGCKLFVDLAYLEEPLKKK